MVFVVQRKTASDGLCCAGGKQPRMVFVVRAQNTTYLTYRLAAGTKHCGRVPAINPKRLHTTLNKLEFRNLLYQI